MPRTSRKAAPVVVETVPATVDHADPDAGRDMQRLDEGQLEMLSTREDYGVLLDQTFANGLQVQLVENPHIAGDRRYAVRTRGSYFGPTGWRLAGNGTLGGIWLGRPSAASSFLNRTLPDDGRFYAVTAG